MSYIRLFDIIKISVGCCFNLQLGNARSLILGYYNKIPTPYFGHYLFVKTLNREIENVQGVKAPKRLPLPS